MTALMQAYSTLFEVELDLEYCFMENDIKRKRITQCGAQNKANVCVVCVCVYIHTVYICAYGMGVCVYICGAYEEKKYQQAS